MKRIIPIALYILCLFAIFFSLSNSASSGLIGAAFVLIVEFFLMIGFSVLYAISGFFATLIFELLGRRDLSNEINQAYNHMNGFLLTVLIFILFAAPAFLIWKAI